MKNNLQNIAKPSQSRINHFHETVWEYYAKHRRDMPWRHDTRPYYILVSELMLQQTQVARVIPKFTAFIHQFPDEKALATAPLSEVVIAWQGLGYNRRARFLQAAARVIVEQYGGEFPRQLAGLITLPGIGKNTAGAIMNYAYNEAVPFVETNVRSALIEHFYHQGEVVAEKEFEQLAAAVWGSEQPREWAWALMDYGSHLKAQGRGRLAQVKSYKKQSPLKGSVREMRGRVVKVLTGVGALPDDALRRQVEADHRYEPALLGLQRDGLIAHSNDAWRLTGS